MVLNFIFLNAEDIDEVYFEGYIDIAEEEAQKIFDKERKKVHIHNLN